MLLLMFVLTIIARVVGLTGNSSSIASNPFSTGFGLFGLIAIPVLIMLVYINIFQVRRLHDLNHSGWWLLLPLPLSVISGIFSYLHIWGASFVSGTVALINISFCFYIFLMPGTAGNNRYGAPRHTPNSEKSIRVDLNSTRRIRSNHGLDKR